MTSSHLKGRVVMYDRVVVNGLEAKGAGVGEDPERTPTKEGSTGGGGGSRSAGSAGLEGSAQNQGAGTPTSGGAGGVASTEKQVGKITNSYLGLVRHVLKNGYKVRTRRRGGTRVCVV